MLVSVMQNAGFGGLDARREAPMSMGSRSSRI